MKILMILDFYGIGQQYQENLIAKYYTLMGHEVHIISSTFQNVFDYVNDRFEPKKPFVETDGYATIHRTPYAFKYKVLFKVLENISPLVSELKPDLIYFHNISLNTHQIVDYVKKHPKTRVIMDYHVDYSNAGQTWKSVHILHGFIRKNYLHRYLKYFKVIFPIVPNGMKFLEEVYKVPKSMMQLLPLGYDEDEAEKIRQNSDSNVIRKQLGLKEGDFLIATGGKFAKEKRTELLLEAVNSINNPRIHVVVFGASTSTGSQYEQQLRDLAHENVHFLGWLNGEEMLTYLNAADLAVYPSSQSVLWQQSIGMHLPLILGDSGNQDPSYLNLHDNIIILQKDKINVQEIADAIKLILFDANKLRQMTEGAKRTATEYLGYRRICQMTIDEAFKS